MQASSRHRIKPGDGIASGVAKQLIEWIASARYPLHSQLPPERELAALLNTPRGKLREALKMLEEEGRIWRRVGMGTFVGGRPRSTGSLPESLGAATTLSEILEARFLIEPLVARLAAQRAGQADIGMIEQYSFAANKAETWAEWERWDELLHRAIAEASGNGILSTRSINCSASRLIRDGPCSRQGGSTPR